MSATPDAAPAVDREQAERFLAALAGPGDPPADATLAVAAREPAADRWHAARFDPAEPERAADTAAGWAEDGRDVYVGRSLVRADLPAGRRGGNADARHVLAVMVDVDRDDGGLVDADAARTLARDLALTLAPTAVVATGGGAQLWWTLAEPDPLDSDDARADHERAARGLAELARRRAPDGWHVDHTGDLARVGRVPGTINRKYEPPRPVALADLDERRYPLDDLLAHTPDDTPAPPPAGGNGHGDVDLAALAEPLDEHGLAALVANDAEAARVWDGDRSHLRDTSVSGGDLALASRAARAGWPDRQLAALVRAHRHHHGDPQGKAGRRDYLERTIAKARNGVEPTSEADDAAAEGEAGDARPGVQVNARTLDALTHDALDALTRANDPPELFVRGGDLARVRRDEHGRHTIERVGKAALRHRLADVAAFHHRRKDGARTDAPPPLHLAENILAAGEWPFPAVVGVTEAPVLRPDGTILDEPGYDPATRLVYRPGGLRVPAVPDQPGPGDVHAAASLLRDELLGDMPFAADADRANALALLLTPIVRPMLGDAPLPLALLDAPTQGSGKGLIAEAVGRMTTGAPPGQRGAPRDADGEEWRKAITALLEAAHPVVVIDNVEAELRSGHLARALTASVWSDRRLGATQDVTVPVRCTWIATGNNLRVGGDMARRCYRIRLDPQHPRPWRRRGFRHADLPGWVDAHRGELLAAALTLGRAWHAAGRPEPDAPPMGNFAPWAHTVGGILAHAGITGFLTNLDELYDAVDAETTAWADFLGWLVELWGDTPFTTGDVADALAHDGTGEHVPDQLAAVADLAAAGQRSARAAIGRQLGQRVGRRYRDDGLRVERHHDPHAKAWRYRIKVDAP